ncbi:diguanylate cyclase [Candidatus Fermentibacteria bacterium]|nr:diguanylate cyclase [Candidatus Fermentibacteria bacterium]
MYCWDPPWRKARSRKALSIGVRMDRSCSENPEIWWIGDSSDPMAALADRVLSDPPTDGPVPDALLVSGELEPETVSRALSEWIGEGVVPWIVRPGRPEEEKNWIRVGAWSVLPSGCAPREASAMVGRLVGGIRRANLSNPLTGLPGNRVIRRILESHIGGSGYFVAYVDINNFKPFNDYYGFARGDAVIRSLASVLSSHLDRHFVGHVGGDDFVCIGRGGGFRKALEKGLSEFRRRVPSFYDERDRAAGGIETLSRSGNFRLYPFMDLTVSVIDSDSVLSVDHLARLAGLQKKEAKGEPHAFPLAEDVGMRAGDLLRVMVRSFSEGRCGSRDTKALIEACGLSGDRSVLPELLDVLQSDECPDLRKSAALALAGLPSEDVSESLISACRDRSPHVRKRAVDALALLGGPAVGPVLVEMLEDRSSWVRRAALRGVGMCGWKRALPILKAGTRLRGTGGSLDKNAIEERRAALDGLALISDPEASQIVSSLLEDRDYRPRETAWQTLMMLGGEEAARMAGHHIETSGLPPPGMELMRGEEMAPDSLRRLSVKLCGLLGKKNRCNMQVLITLGRLPGELPEACLDSLSDGLGYMRGKELEELIKVLDRKEVPPPSGRLPQLVGRIRSNRRLLSKAGCVSLMGWIARRGSVHPGLLIEPFLRHGSREVSTAAARAVLCSARRLMESEDRTD